jgi:hypothetical protein
VPKGKARPGKARQGKARQGKARQSICYKKNFLWAIAPVNKDKYESKNG